MDPDFAQNAWYEIQLRGFPEPMAEQMIEGLRKAGLIIAMVPTPKKGSSS